MLINCPKCNFSQPKDRYCASCGIDMDTFRPTPPSWSTKFWNNPTAPLGLILAVAIGSFWYIRHQFRMADAPVAENGRFVRMKSADAPVPMPAPPVAAGEVAPPPPPGSDASMEVAASAASATAEALPASASMRGFGAGAPGGGDNPSESTADDGSTATSFPLKFTFVEIPKALMERLLEEQKKAGPNGLDQAQVRKLWDAVAKNPDSELYAVSYPFQSNRLAMKRNISGEGQGVDAGEAGLRLDADVNMRAPASTASNTGASLLAGSLQLNAHLRLEEQGNLHSKEKSLSGNFSFKPGNAWVYHVDLPRGPLGDTGQVPTGVHRVFLSESFQKRETEVTLIVELDKQSEY